MIFTAKQPHITANGTACTVEKNHLISIICLLNAWTQPLGLSEIVFLHVCYEVHRSLFMLIYTQTDRKKTKTSRRSTFSLIIPIQQCTGTETSTASVSQTSQRRTDGNNLTRTPHYPTQQHHTELLNEVFTGDGDKYGGERSVREEEEEDRKLVRKQER